MEWKDDINPFNSLKVLCWKDEFMEIINGNIPNPVSVTVDSTNFCNLSCDFCLIKGTKILMSDFTWKNIEDVVENDETIGFKNNQFIISKVYHTMNRMANQFVTINTDETEDLTLTYGHRVLKSDKHKRSWWTPSEHLKLTDYVKILPYIESQISPSYMRGWMAGMADGDGCFWTENNNKAPQHRFRLAVRDTEILERFKEYAKAFNIELYDRNHNSGLNNKLFDKTDENKNITAIFLCKTHEVQKLKKLLYENIEDENNEFKRGWVAGFFDAEGSLYREASGGATLRIFQKKSLEHDRCLQYFKDLGFDLIEEKSRPDSMLLHGGFKEIYKFFMKSQPVLLRKMKKLWGNGSRNTKTKIRELIHYELEQPVYNIETETENYIANGILVHNCHYAEYRDEKKCNVSSDKLKWLADTLENMGVQSVCYSGGGEPFIHPYSGEFIRSLKDKDIDVGTITNGVLIDAFIDDIIYSCRWIGISVDSATEETYIKLKGGTSKDFERLVDNIMNLVDKRKNDKSPSIGFKFLIHPFNYNELLDAAEFAYQIGVDDFHARPCYNPSMKWPEKSFAKIHRQIDLGHKMYDECDGFNFYGITHKFDDKFQKKEMEKCEVTPIAGLTFAADGYCYVCCLPKNTRIDTLNGVKEIQNVSINDYVLTHKNRYKKVNKTFERKANEIIHLSSYGWFEELVATPEHPVLAIKKKNRYCKNVGKSCPFYSNWNKCIDCDSHIKVEPKFIPIKELEKGDYVFSMIDSSVNNDAAFLLKEHGLELDEDFAWMIGLYIAEGNILKRAGKKDSCNGIQFSLGIADMPFIPRLLRILKNKFNKDAKITQNHNKVYIQLFKSDVGRIFKELVGEYSHKKKMHISLMTMPLNLQKSLLFGWSDGDGFHRKKDNTYHITTTSKELIYQMWKIALRCGYPATTYDWKILGKNRKQAYTLFFAPNKTRNRCVFFWKDYLVSTIKNINVEEKHCDVFNIEVEEDNTYIANSIIVHNCDLRGEKMGKLCKWEKIQKVWGSEKHKEILEKINPALCPHRCTYGSYQTILDKVFREDKMTFRFP